jgi:outer membrane protein
MTVRSLLRGASMCLLLATFAAPVVAQPGQTTTTGSGSAAGPDWLVGVTEVNGMEKPPEGTLTLTLDKALDIAQKVQPNIRTAQANVALAQGKVDQTRVVIQPTVVVSAGIFASSSHDTTTFAGSGSGVGGGGTGNSTGNTGSFFSLGLGTQTGLSAVATWRMYDFGLTQANIDAAQYSVDAAVAGVGSAVLDVRKNVESAYLQAVAQRRLVLVADATVKSEEGHVDQARRFVAAQAQDPIQLAQAQARLANAKSAAAQARSNEAVALATLRAAIGWVELENDLAVDPNWPVPPSDDPPGLRDLVADARAHRPEVVQANAQLQSADASLAAAHYERRPTLTASATTAWNPGTDLSNEPQPVWAAGVSLSWSLWDGGKSAADVRVANASLKAAYAARDELLVGVTSQLDSARSQIVANKANVSASTEAVTTARAQLQLSEARYTQGVGSQIELADAQTAVTTAEGNLVTAEWQLADAWAQLRRALGRI